MFYLSRFVETAASVPVLCIRGPLQSNNPCATYQQCYRLLWYTS